MGITTIPIATRRRRQSLHGERVKEHVEGNRRNQRLHELTPSPKGTGNQTVPFIFDKKLISGSL